VSWRGLKQHNLIISWQAKQSPLFHCPTPKTSSRDGASQPRPPVINGKQERKSGNGDPPPQAKEEVVIDILEKNRDCAKMLFAIPAQRIQRSVSTNGFTALERLANPQLLLVHDL
jgi:hypothetical protein